jgi:hypothetical protein
MDQLLALKQMLMDFASSIGLQVNFHKSSIVPINVPEETMTELAGAFGCQIGTLPFTYLGLPLGNARPQIKDLLPLVTRLERRLTSISHFPSQGTRLQLVDSCLSLMSIFSYAPCICLRVFLFLWREFLDNIYGGIILILPSNLLQHGIC